MVNWIRFATRGGLEKLLFHVDSRRALIYVQTEPLVCRSCFLIEKMRTYHRGSHPYYLEDLYVKRSTMSTNSVPPGLTVSKQRSKQGDILFGDIYHL
jgi:hypothetical protein